jgi:hypothetical protein
VIPLRAKSASADKAAPQAEKRRGPPLGYGSAQQSLTSAAAAWGDELPDWIEALAQSCDRSSQSQVAKRLDYSGSVISSVLKRNYNGNYATVEQAVRGALLRETHECPVLGEIAKDLCLANQKKARAFNPTSSARVQLYRACRGPCPFSRMARPQEEVFDADA